MDTMTTATSTIPQAPPGAGRVIRMLLGAPFAGATWRAFAYVLLSVLFGIAGFVYLIAGLVPSGVLLITVVGVPLLAAVVLGGRAWGRLYRGTARALLRTSIDNPTPFQASGGPLRSIAAALSDRAAWRALAFLAIASTFSVIVGSLVLLFAVLAISMLVSPIPWVLANPVNIGSDGTVHHSLIQFGDTYIETWPQVIAVSAIGLACCFLAPWPLRGFATLQSMLTSLLLGPTQRDLRVEHLERTRSSAVQDSATTLRRVERDLHDGTQAKIVSMAMALGRAEEELAADDSAKPLVAEARSTAKETLRELREMVRAIHPPSLDLGLAPALETLVSRSAVPADLEVDVPQRPAPGIEAIAYFSVAELLTNVTKHAGATHAQVQVLLRGSALTVTVRDDGSGGAGPGGGTGLAGLMDRAAAVDGTVEIDSPAGGPTVVTVSLPTTEAIR